MLYRFSFFFQVSSLNFLSLFPNLRHLSVASTPITTESMNSLADLKNLEELNLSHTNVRNDGFSHLTGMFVIHCFKTLYITFRHLNDNWMKQSDVVTPTTH